MRRRSCASRRLQCTSRVGGGKISLPPAGKGAPTTTASDTPLRTDHLVIGSGIAGLTYALEAARTGDVLVLAKGAREDSATRWAQGGIASVVGPGDSVDAHVQDTLATGDAPASCGTGV